MLGPQPKLNKQGKPVMRNGKPVMVSASTWLMQNRRVEQMTWVPGEPPLIRDRLAVDGGWIHRPEVTALNLYRPPRIELGTQPKPTGGSSMCARSFPTTPTTSSVG